MNLQEFKAWFEGFTENMKQPPSAKAWARIKERVGEITEQPTEIRYFYDHYWRPYYGAWPYSQVLCGGTVSPTLVTSGYSNAPDLNAIGQNGTTGCAGAPDGVTYTLTSTQAFNGLGRADAASL